MSATAITPLLDILADADNPGYAQALTRLTTLLETFDPASLPAAERTALLARLSATIDSITTQKDDAAIKLQSLRGHARALQSYGNK